LIENHITTPTGVSPATLAEVMGQGTFLTSLESQVSAALNISVGITYNKAPEAKFTAPETPAPGLGLTLPDDGSTTDGGADLFEPHPDSITAGFSLALVGVVAAVTVVCCCFGGAYFYGYPMWKRIKHERQHSKVSPQDDWDWDDDRAASPKGRKNQPESPTARGGDLPLDGDTIEPEEGKGVGGPPTEQDETPAAPPAPEEPSPAQTEEPTPSPAPPPPAQPAAVRPSGRFGHARARLYDLQSQLDKILSELPGAQGPGGAGPPPQGFASALPRQGGLDSGSAGTAAADRVVARKTGGARAWNPDAGADRREKLLPAIKPAGGGFRPQAPRPPLSGEGAAAGGGGVRGDAELKDSQSPERKDQEGDDKGHV